MDLFRVISKFHSFGKVSGSALNISKSSGSWIGPWASPQMDLLGIKWSVNQVPRYLGIRLSSLTENLSWWQEKLSCLRAVTLPWAGRVLSYTDRAYLCNQVLFPAIWFQARNMYIPDSVISKCERLLAVTVWGGGLEKMSRTNLYLPYRAGGFGLVYLTAKLAAYFSSWVTLTASPLIEFFKKFFLAGFLPQMVITSGSFTKNLSSATLHYRHIARHVGLALQTFSPESLHELPRNKIYWGLVEALCPAPIYRMPLPASRYDREVLIRLRKCPLDMKQRRFYQEFHTRTLWTRVFRKEKNLEVDDVHCPFCPLPQTVEHVFLICRVAEDFWFDFRKFFGLSWNFQLSTLRYLSWPDTQAFPRTPAAAAILVIAMHAIWTSTQEHEEQLRFVRPPWTIFLSQMKQIARIYPEDFGFVPV